MKKALVLFLALLVQRAYPQGCSDAGFCSVGTLKPDHSLEPRSRIALSQSYGRAEQKTSVWVTQLEYSGQLSEKGQLQVLVPYSVISGNLGNISGLSDLTLAGSYRLLNFGLMDISGTAGAKIPFNAANRKSADGLPLPMVYQTSLGTYDLILGLSAAAKKWIFALGYQHPFGSNKNEYYDHADVCRRISIACTVPGPYGSSRHYKRGSDLLIRYERIIAASRIDYILGLLPIFRLRNDEIQHLDGSYIVIKDSKGLTLNVTGMIKYRLKEHGALKLFAGAPVITRKVKTDGLQRSFLISLGYEYNFK
jgi:hypothetical protein